MTAEDLPETTTLIEEDYQHLIQRLVRENRQRQAAADSMLEDLTSYYTSGSTRLKHPSRQWTCCYKQGLTEPRKWKSN